MTDQCTEERAKAKARQERCGELAFSYSLHIISLKPLHTHTHPRPLIVTFEEGQLSAFSSTFLRRHERQDCALFPLKETLYLLSVQKRRRAQRKQQQNPPPPKKPWSWYGPRDVTRTARFCLSGEVCTACSVKLPCANNKSMTDRCFGMAGDRQS